MPAPATARPARPVRDRSLVVSLNAALGVAVATAAVVAGVAIHALNGPGHAGMTRTLMTIVAGVNEIAERITDVARTSDHTAVSVGDARTAVAELARTSTQLQDVVGRFRL